MNQCNGMSIRDIKLEKFRTRNEIYYDNLCMLDIEVSTAFNYDGKLIPFDRSRSAEFWRELDAYSLLYLWNVCIDGYLFCGRTTRDLLIFLDNLNELLDGIFYIYVHNLSYEFQFLRNILYDIDVFARKKRKPIKFLWKNIEFRCSYMLTRLSLDEWATQKNLSVKKLTGMYDYSKLRTPYTSLSTLERDYGYNDVLTGVCGLREYKERYKHVKDIPLTQTSCIRKEVNKVMSTEYKARKRVSKMTDVSLDIYRFMIDCFIGGYTHANIILANRVLSNMWDYDISSSYPWTMLSEKYPYTPWTRAYGHYDRYMNSDRYCYMIEVTLYGIDSIYFNTYISASKALEIENPLLDNGRVISADKITLRLLDVDYKIILSSYHIEKKHINVLYYALKDYLPTEFRKYILSLYNHKTSLKGIEEKFLLYFKSKEEVNGCYGMAVTKDITDEVIYTNFGWDIDKLTETKYYEKVEDKKKKLYRLNLSYSQGIYVPAYGRQNLWRMVYDLDDLIAYMDTDSLKLAPPHDGILEIIESYNANIHEKQKQLAEQLNVSYDMFNPRDSKGKVHSIGIYERDDDIIKFKTLGAKRYICQYEESKGLDYLKMTVSGVQKKAVYQLNSIDDFNEDTVFSVDYAKKLLLLYNDNQQNIVWNKGQYDEYECTDQYGIAGYNIPYTLGVTPDYLRLIKKSENDVTSIFKRKVLI